jgi:phage terminase small subunit
MGRRAKLPIIKALEGNPGKRAIEEFGIEAQGEPFVPEHLSDDAQGCIEVIRRSMPPRVYSALDSFLLAAFAHAWFVHKVAVGEINQTGFTWVVTNKRTGAESMSPWLKIANSQAQLMASLGDRLGLDPKARAALKLPDARQQRSRFAGLIGQTGSSLSSNA